MLCWITAVGAVIWSISLQFLRPILSRGRAKEEAARPLDGEERPPANWICGHAKVEGRPERLPGKPGGTGRGIRRRASAGKDLERGDDRIMFKASSTTRAARKTGTRRPRSNPLRHRWGRPDERSLRCPSCRRQIRMCGWAMPFRAWDWWPWLHGFCLSGRLGGPDPDPASTLANPPDGAGRSIPLAPVPVRRTLPVGRRRLHGGLDLLIHNLPYQDA